MPTRCYFPSSGTPAVTPAISSTWEVSSDTRLPLNKTPAGTTQTSYSVSEFVATSPVDGMIRQYVSDPLLTPSSIGGTFSIVIKGRESATAADMFLQLRIVLVSNDGLTERAVLYAGQTETIAQTSGPAQEFSTSDATRSLSSVALTSASVTSGDRIVVELGWRASNITTTGRSGFLTIGDQTDIGDLALGNGSNAHLRPWIEFSQDGLFDAPSYTMSALVPGIQGSVSMDAILNVGMDTSVPNPVLAAEVFGPADVELNTSVPTPTANVQMMAGLVSLEGTVSPPVANIDMDPVLIVFGEPSEVVADNGDGYLEITSNLMLDILDPAIERAPTALQVTVGGAQPGATLTFSISGTTVWTDTADLDGELGTTAIPIPEAVVTAAGTWTLTVTSTTSGTDTATFTVERAPSPHPATQVADADPVVVPNSTGRWVLQDLLPGGLGSWVMPINPRSQTSPHFERTVDGDHTTGQDGIHQLTEGGPQVKPWKLSGYFPDQAYHDQLLAYANINRRFYVIDHRGRAWTVAVSALNLELRPRQRDAVSEDNDWAGNWTLDLVIYDQVWAVPA